MPSNCQIIYLLTYLHDVETVQFSPAKTLRMVENLRNG